MPKPRSISAGWVRIRTGDTLGEKAPNGNAEFLHSLKGKIYATVVSERLVAAFAGVAGTRFLPEGHGVSAGLIDFSSYRQE